MTDVSIRPKISICLPTRGRPQRVENMISSAISLASNASDLEFFLYCDLDDQTMKGFSYSQTQVIYGPRLSVSNMTNIAFGSSKGQIIMYAADDIIFRTVGWDNLLLDSINTQTSKYWLISGDDLGQTSNKIATHGFVSRELAELLGYLLPPYFSAEFCDTWLTSITRLSKTQLRLSELVIEHMHPSWSKAPLDDTYNYRKQNLHFYKDWLRFHLLLPLRLYEVGKIYFYKRLDNSKI